MVSDSPATEHHGSCTAKKSGLGALLAVIVLSQAVWAWSAWQGSKHLSNPGTSGNLYSVTLVSGAVYYGHSVDSPAGYVKLTDVYYVENAFVDNKMGRSDSRLINRQKNDWHGPEWMAIPVDKVLLMEQVGAQSRLAKLIEQDSMQTTVK